MRRARIPSAANKGVLSAIFALSFVIMAGEALISAAIVIAGGVLPDLQGSL